MSSQSDSATKATKILQESTESAKKIISKVKIESSCLILEYLVGLGLLIFGIYMVNQWLPIAFLGWLTLVDNSKRWERLSQKVQFNLATFNRIIGMSHIISRTITKEKIH